MNLFLPGEGIPIELLKKLYFDEKKSSAYIAKQLHCSEHKVNYWLLANGINKRSISEAIYVKHNPKGDPFKFIQPKNLEEAKLFGMGIGLYWGEGNKANKTTVRLGNSDPALMRIFIRFLIKFFNIKESDLRFQLQIFTDLDINKVLDYWLKELKVNKNQFYKTVVTKSGSLGTYINKSQHGVVSVYYGNIKLKKLLMELLPR